MNDLPVFSVVVLTYNQESLIEETLNSVCNQTYPNIELIISDDASTDNTVAVVKQWIEKFGDRFVKVTINVNKKNSGISGNHSIGLKLSTGEFVKYIGGDDLLFSDALEKMANFLMKNKNANFCVAKVKEFVDIGGKKITVSESPSKTIMKRLERSQDAETQFRILSLECSIPAPGTFFRRIVFEKYGYPDESYKKFEDWHQWLKFLLNGERLYILNDTLVWFRKHMKSVSTSAIYTGNTKFFEETIRVYKEYVFPNIEKLSLLEALSVVSKVKYLNTLIQHGANISAHRIARKYNLVNPIWWKSLPLWPFRKMQSIRLRKLLKKSSLQA